MPEFSEIVEQVALEREAIAQGLKKLKPARLPIPPGGLVDLNDHNPARDENAVL